VLRHSPRDANRPFLDSNDLKQMLLQSTIITCGAFGSYGWGRYRYGTHRHASTMAFMSLTVAQLLHTLNCLSDRHSLFSADRPPTNGFLKLGLGIGFGLQSLTIAVPPLRRLLRNAPLTPFDLAISLLGAGLPLLANEAIKFRAISAWPDHATSDRTLGEISGEPS
jgi:Ca2+-transporting ATPase